MSGNMNEAFCGSDTKYNSKANKWGQGSAVKHLMAEELAEQFRNGNTNLCKKCLYVRGLSYKEGSYNE